MNRRRSYFTNNNNSPLKPSPIEYAMDNYSDELVEDLRKDRKKYVLYSVICFAAGIVIATIFTFLRLSLVSLIAFMVGLGSSCIIPGYFAPMWSSYKRSYKKGDDFLKEWEEEIGLDD